MTSFLLVAQIVFGSPFLQGAVCPERGGELCSLKVQHKGQWVETLYSSGTGTTGGWTGRAHWLWPAVGKGAPVPFHGFVRDLPWQTTEKSKDAVTVTVSDNATTRETYPYGFALQANYRAVGRKLVIRFKATAAPANKAAMPFSAGNHISFRTPMIPGGAPAALTLRTPSTIEHKKLDGSPTGERVARSLAQPIALQDFDARVAVSLGGYTGDPFMELRDPGGLAVRISHTATSVPSEPVVRFNMWGDPTKGYFCPEPIVGLQDGHRLQQGLVRLEPGKEWEWVITVEFVN